MNSPKKETNNFCKEFIGFVKPCAQHMYQCSTLITQYYEIIQSTTVSIDCLLKHRKSPCIHFLLIKVLYLHTAVPLDLYK